MPKKPLKVVVIGGGSSYTPEIIEGLLQRKDTLPLSELWLTDVAAGREKLAIVAQLTERMVRKAGNPFPVKSSLER
jgi:6-phospho-beta-glucosidase